MVSISVSDINDDAQQLAQTEPSISSVESPEDTTQMDSEISTEENTEDKPA